ncbi:hypothetical protein M0805_006129 [Coniferiporia weirii]|nr:hypothetical protein M0805_006129 [Coniferiporia weirii]
MPKRQFVQSSTHEIVEDSEPERQESQRRLKEERRRKRELRKADKALKVIELSDSDSISSVAHTDVCTSKNVSDVAPSLTTTSSSISLLSNIDIVGLTNGPADVGATSVDPVPPPRPADNTVPDVVNARIEESSDSETDERTSRVRAQLCQYMFSGLSQGSSARDRASRASLVPVDDTAIDAAKHRNARAKKRKGPSNNYYLDFTEDQLNCLRKCVSCDIKWTSRKTVAQKVSHIRSCAKKGRITDETLGALISRLVESESSTSESIKNPKTRKQAVSTPARDLPPKTFLQDVIDEAEVQRTSKRKKQTPDSVKNVTETRSDIINRAKLLINHSAISSTASSEIPIPVATQAFGKSKLGTRAVILSSGKTTAGVSVVQALEMGISSDELSREPNSDHSDLEGSVMGPLATLDAPPLTQPFSSSNLASSFSVGRSNTGMNMVSSCTTTLKGLSYDMPEAATEPEIRDKWRTPYLDASNNYSLGKHVFCTDETTPVFEIEKRARHKPGTESSPTCPQSRPSYILEGRDGIPDVPAAIVSTNSPGKPPRIRLLEEEKANEAGGRCVPSSDNQRRKAISDDELFDRLKVALLSNERLYLRVLRYEPIHFEVFMEMARGHNAAVPALKTKVKAFLDSQAIHYYGCETFGRQTKR